MTRRLVFLTPDYSDAGGVARRSQALAAAFADRGWRVLVLARAPHLTRPRLIRRPNLTVVEIPGFTVDRVGSLLFLLCALPVGTALGWTGASFLAIKLMSSSSTAALCAMLSRRPFVTMATSSGLDSEVDFLLRAERASAPGLRLRRTLLRRAAYIVAQTPAAAEDLARLVGPERIAVVPNPVVAIDPRPLGGQPRAVFTGRLSRHKDPLTLLDGWRIVVDHRPDAQLTIVGDGGRHESTEASVRARLAGDPALRRSVRLTGWVPDVTPYLLEADVFVLPSLTEGMSNSLLEACALGRVAVASDIPANRFVLGNDYPLLFPAGDAEALARCVLEAFAEDAKRSHAVERIVGRLQQFSLDRVVDRIEQLLVAEGTPAPTGRRGIGSPSAST